MSVEDLEARIAMMEEISEVLKMDIQRADAAIVKLRSVHRDIKYLLEHDIPRIVAEAVALHISRSKIEVHAVQVPRTQDAPHTP